VPEKGGGMGYRGGRVERRGGGGVYSEEGSGERGGQWTARGGRGVRREEGKGSGEREGEW
jgi:hypothetical protein